MSDVKIQNTVHLQCPARLKSGQEGERALSNCQVTHHGSTGGVPVSDSAASWTSKWKCQDVSWTCCSGIHAKSWAGDVNLGVVHIGGI